jgi:hypothetical protein
MSTAPESSARQGKELYLPRQGEGGRWREPNTDLKEGAEGEREEGRGVGGCGHAPLPWRWLSLPLLLRRGEEGASGRGRGWSRRRAVVELGKRDRNPGYGIAEESSPTSK